MKSMSKIQPCVRFAVSGRSSLIQGADLAERMQAVLFIGDLAYADDYVSALAHGMLS